jgi:hypothetical protein
VLHVFVAAVPDEPAHLIVRELPRVVLVRVLANLLEELLVILTVVMVLVCRAVEPTHKAFLLRDLLLRRNATPHVENGRRPN